MDGSASNTSQMVTCIFNLMLDEMETHLYATYTVKSLCLLNCQVFLRYKKTAVFQCFILH